MRSMNAWRYSPRILAGVMAGMLLALASRVEQVQAQQQPAPQPAAPSAVELGKRHFVTYLCHSCHGYAGHGGADDGPRLDTNRLSYEAFSRYVRKPVSSMPRYAGQKQIPETALEEIYAYLKSVPPSPDPKSIPLLKDD